MTAPPNSTPTPRRLRDWIRLFLALAGVAAAFMVFASGITPPGFAGEVLRHNQANDIDASPLFYSEVENMAELERGVAKLRAEANNRRSLDRPERSAGE